MLNSHPMVMTAELSIYFSEDVWNCLLRYHKVEVGFSLRNQVAQRLDFLLWFSRRPIPRHWCTKFEMRILMRRMVVTMKFGAIVVVCDIQRVDSLLEGA